MIVVVLSVSSLHHPNRDHGRVADDRPERTGAISLTYILSIWYNIHCVSEKKFPPLNSLLLCQILTDFQSFCTAGKRMKFATKPMQQYPSHLRHVATLPWEIRSQIFCRYSADIAEMQTYCILIASNFVVHLQILIFSVFKIASLSSNWFQIKVLSKSCSRRFIPCWLLRDTAVASAVTNSRSHKLIANVYK